MPGRATSTIVFYIVGAGEKADILIDGVDVIPQLVTAVGAVQQISHSLQKTTGWLVCIKGNMIGESFPIREGKNRIGRSTAMDIILLYENSISREDHACILYEPANRTFTLTSKHTQNIVKVNDQEPSGFITLHNRDVITLGKCTLVFISFCNEVFGWDK